MNLIHLACRSYHSLERLQPLDFLPPLLLRLYLAPIFIEAGAHKLDFPSLLPNAGTVQWFEIRPGPAVPGPDGRPGRMVPSFSAASCC